MQKSIFTLIAAICCTTMLAGPKFDFGDRFAFAGLESAKLVPPTGTKILDRKVPVRDMDHRPIKDAIYIYSGETRDDVSVDQLNAYVAQVFEAVKAASKDGKVYKEPSYGDTKLVGEKTEPDVFAKSYGTLRCVYKHGDKWFSVHAGRSVDYPGRVWLDDTLPEKFFVWTIYVIEYFIDEEQ